MARPRTRADALTLWLSGASSAGAAQPDAALSLGGYRSSTRAGSLASLLTNPIPGIRVDYVAGANGEGAGLLTADGTDAVSWTPPDGTAGSAVTVLAGEQRLLEAGDGETDKFVLVTRTAADDLVGLATVDLVRTYNDVLGQADAENDGFV